MISDKKSILDAFSQSPVRGAQELINEGYARIQLTRAVRSGTLRKIARGVYCLKEYQQNEHGDLALVACKAPNAVICLLSALRFHELTTQAPFEVWIAIRNKDYPPRLEYPRLRVVRFSDASIMEGYEVHIIDGVEVRITSIEKTIADCFKFRNKVGLDVALEALKDAYRSKRLDQNVLWKYAKIDRVANVMMPYLEALG
jgi:predicted transcriptional regulator of viral defense system